MKWEVTLKLLLYRSAEMLPRSAPQREPIVATVTTKPVPALEGSTSSRREGSLMPAEAIVATGFKGRLAKEAIAGRVAGRADFWRRTFKYANCNEAEIMRARTAPTLKNDNAPPRAVGSKKGDPPRFKGVFTRYRSIFSSTDDMEWVAASGQNKPVAIMSKIGSIAKKIVGRLN